MLTVITGDCTYAVVCVSELGLSLYCCYAMALFCKLEVVCLLRCVYSRYPCSDYFYSFIGEHNVAIRM